MELVVGASESTMNTLLGKLGNLLAQEYALIRGVRGDIQYISDELSSMKAFLLDLAKDDQDNRKKDWMKQIRDMAYDSEDCIDDFAYRLPKDSSNFDIKCCPWIVTLMYDLWTWGPRREIASNIADLKVRAQLIAERRIRYGVENPQTKNGHSDASMYDIAAEDQLASHELSMKEPVGMVEDMKKLEEWVNNPSEEPAVVSIVGFGGVGKTTIAMALFKRVMYQFDCRAWVTVSQNYDQDAVLNDILKQINPDHHKQQHGKTGTSEKTVERLGSKLKMERLGSKLKRDAQLRGGHMQRGNDGGSNVKHTETTGNNKLKSEIREHLDKRRYIQISLFSSFSHTSILVLVSIFKTSLATLVCG